MALLHVGRRAAFDSRFYLQDRYGRCIDSQERNTMINHTEKIPLCFLKL